MYRQALEHHQQVMAWHRGLEAGTERRQVAALAAMTGGYMGWHCYDLGRHDEAAVWYRQAAGLAADADDVSQCANNIGQMSRTLFECGRYQDALAFADTAVGVAGTAAHPAVRSWLRAVRARYHACLGDERACRADLDGSAALLGRIHDGERPVYIGYFDLADHQKWTGHALVQLGVTRPALLAEGRAAIEQARTMWPERMVRGSAEVLATCAQAYLATGEVEEAAWLTGQAYTVASSTGSARNLRSASEVRGMLSPYRNTRAVRELDERLLTGQ